MTSLDSGGLKGTLVGRQYTENVCYMPDVAALGSRTARFASDGRLTLQQLDIKYLNEVLK